MANIFRQAKNLLDKKARGAELTEEELGVVNTALIPFTVNTGGFFPEDITIGEGLEELARMIENESAEEDQQTPAPIEEVAMAERTRLTNFSTDLTKLTNQKGGRNVLEKALEKQNRGARGKNKGYPRYSRRLSSSKV
ncbi:hypothetical protein ES706_05252 [subsurface metagenome]